MTRFARVDFDTVAPLMPFDKMASQVTGRGEHFEWTAPEHVMHSETPIETRQAAYREKNDPRYVELTGSTFGRLKVIGISASSDHDKRRWVVRCQCGDYEIRKARYIKQCLSGEQEGPAMCMECGYTQRLQRGIHNPKKAAAAAEAIQEAAR
jgi:hypothetical protein